MKKKNIFIFCIFFYFISLRVNFLKRDYATHIAHCGDWKRSNQMLANLTVKDPDSADLLYDSGVAAFKISEFEKAHAYFNNAKKSSNASEILKKQACFNLGNTCVELKKFEDAIAQYKQVLFFDAHDEKAKHNLEVVKNMLEQQKNQDQKKEQQQKKEKNNKNSQEKKENDSDDQKSNEQQNSDGQSKSSPKKNEQQKEGQDDRGDDSRNQSDKDGERNQENSSSNNLDDKEREQKKQDEREHDGSPEQKEKKEQQSASQDTDPARQEQENKKNSSSKGKAKRYDDQVMRILSATEKDDAQAHKKMMAENVKKATGHYDKNQNNY